MALGRDGATSAKGRKAMLGEAYFLYHSIGQYPGKSADMAAAMAELAGIWGTPDDAQWGYALGKRAAFIARWEALIGADRGSLTTSENVTASLYSLIGALPGKSLKGKKVLIAGDCFPSVHFLLNGLAPRLGFELVTVALRQGAAWAEDEDILSQWGPDVGLALLTWVSSTSSHRSNLAALVAHGRSQGTVIGVDITQAAGLLPFDVADPMVDFVISTSLKWMCGTPGAGVLYVRPEVILDCQPEFRGWFSQPNPFSWDFDKFAYAPDIRRFDNGTPGVVAAVSSLPAMDWHAAQDQAALLAHNRALSAQILDGVEALGLRLASPRDPAARGGSVMVHLPADRPATAILEAFRAEKIYADARGQILRLSPGVMTTPAGVVRMLTVLGANLKH
jgi:kynureninase